MAENRDLVYLYDGTLEGLFCCVFESFLEKEIPAAIFGPDATQYTLYPMKQILSDQNKSRRVLDAVGRKISNTARELVLSGYLTCAPDKELLIVKFLHLGFQYGPNTVDMIQDETVSGLVKAVRFLRNEAHLLKGFLRFSQLQGGLAATISPKNVVLPELLGHFSDRLPDEQFLIFDRTHHMAAVYRPYEGKIVSATSFEMESADKDEQEFRRLWRRFYETIAIEGRYNPQCRMTHCPKRYWENMTELSSASAGGNEQSALEEIAVKQLPTAIGK